MMEIGPIFRALTRNKLGALLIALQIALTLAIVTNAAFIIGERAADIARPSGLDEAGSELWTTPGFNAAGDFIDLNVTSTVSSFSIERPETCS